jgi:hypothetical protein
VLLLLFRRVKNVVEEEKIFGGREKEVRGLPTLFVPEKKHRRG